MNPSTADKASSDAKVKMYEVHCPEWHLGDKEFVDPGKKHISFRLFLLMCLGLFNNLYQLHKLQSIGS